MNSFVEVLSPIAETWWFYVLHATWQSTVVAVVFLAIIWAVRRLPAQILYGLILIALLKFAIPASLSGPTGLFSHFGPVVTDNSAQTLPGQADEYAADRSDADSVAAGRRWQISCYTWLMGVHVLGALGVGGWFIVQLVRVSRMARRARTVRTGPLHRQMLRVGRIMHLRRKVRLLVTAEAVPPMAFGVLRPAVMIPTSLSREMSPSELEAVLAHELAHHRRGDLWINWLQIVLSVVWWFNPIVWVLNRVVRRVRENCCDDFMLARGLTSEGGYCDTLLRVARLSPMALLGGVPGFAERLHPLEERIRRIMDPHRFRSPKILLINAPLMLLLGALVLPGVRSVAGPEGQDSPASVVTHESENPSVDSSDLALAAFSDAADNATLEDQAASIKPIPKAAPEIVEMDLIASWSNPGDYLKRPAAPGGGQAAVYRATEAFRHARPMGPVLPKVGHVGLNARSEHLQLPRQYVNAIVPQVSFQRWLFSGHASTPSGHAGPLFRTEVWSAVSISAQSSAPAIDSSLAFFTKPASPADQAETDIQAPVDRSELLPFVYFDKDQLQFPPISRRRRPITNILDLLPITDPESHIKLPGMIDPDDSVIDVFEPAGIIVLNTGGRLLGNVENDFKLNGSLEETLNYATRIVPLDSDLGYWVPYLGGITPRLGVPDRERFLEPVADVIRRPEDSVNIINVPDVIVSLDTSGRPLPYDEDHYMPNGPQLQGRSNSEIIAFGDVYSRMPIPGPILLGNEVVPEPVMLLPLVLGGLIGLRRRRRSHQG